ncbi:S9 family peptidase [soil metagenome]
MFAKFSPDASHVAYVSKQNLYVENIVSHTIKSLTTGGGRRNIFGTFDWAYEEEFGARDGFRWSPDGTKIAFWHVDATKIRDIPLINNTDSIAPFVVPVEYPLVGESPSPTQIGVVTIATGEIKWMKIPGDPQQNYLPRMEWADNSKELIVQQVNRKQNETNIFICSTTSADVQLVYHEMDDAFIECRGPFLGDDIMGWTWVNKGNEFIWTSEKDGWMHAYLLSKDGKKEKLLTPGNYDIAEINFIDEKNNAIYFTASPGNSLQKELYKTTLDGNGKLVRITPVDQSGTHGYDISPSGSFAKHTFSNNYTQPTAEYIQLKSHVTIKGTGSVADALRKSAVNKKVEFFKVTTSDGIVLDGWMMKPTNFDPNKKYPVVFFVYGEPANTTVLDTYGVSNNFLYKGNMADDGYIAMSLDNRGTPSLKGRAWRKSIYRNIGNINIRDQALGVKEVLKWPFVDSNRTAVWGWSGGANTTLHLLGQYPDLFKAGFAGASVANQLTYDNIYTERYMGLPQENMEGYVKGSPITYVKNIKAPLLYVHGTGDDNVHYQNAELLLNEFIKYNKQVRFMAYPNRTHGAASEGAETHLHMSTLYTNFLKEFCPPGGR